MESSAKLLCVASPSRDFEAKEIDVSLLVLSDGQGIFVGGLLRDPPNVLTNSGKRISL
jgi:hypothetical protein